MDTEGQPEGDDDWACAHIAAALAGCDQWEVQHTCCNTECTSTPCPASTYVDNDQATPIWSTMPNGAIHVCGAGVQCNYLQINEDGYMTCPFSGLVHNISSVCTIDQLNGGACTRRSKDSGDYVDSVCGRRHLSKDTAARSRRALLAAQTRPCATSTPSLSREQTPTPEKVTRTIRKNTPKKTTTPNMAVMMREAEAVVRSLINGSDKSTEREKCVAKEKEAAAEAHNDPRSMVRRYVRKCLANCSPITLDAIHNIYLLNLTERTTDKEITNKPSVLEKNIAAIINHIMLLWNLITKTPYMQRNSRRSIFRPYCAAVLFSMRRGIYLVTGECIIPPFQSVASILPTLRSGRKSTEARSMLSASHKGVCTIERAINSLHASDQKKLLSPALASCSRLLEHYS